MSRPRGNSVQRALFAAAKEEAEARGWSARLDFTTRGSAQHAIFEKEGRGAIRIAIHGTPRDADREMMKMRGRVRRALTR